MKQLEGTRVTCIGAGVIGTGWAVTFARAGVRVTLCDESEAALDLAGATLRKTFEQLGTGTADAAEVLHRVRLEADLERALVGAEYVQESITENREQKRVLLEAVSDHAPHAIIGSSTSELVPSFLFEGLRCAPRALVAHPINPPYLIPVVELCRSPWTTDAAFNACHSLLLSIGQQPVLVRHEIAGFLVNRLQAAVLGEAMHLIGEGFADVSDIDIAVSEALGPRWALLGPITTAHLNAPNGVSEYMEKFGASYADLSRTLRVDYPWSAELITRVAEQVSSLEQSGNAWTSGERDLFLMKLTNLKTRLKRLRGERVADLRGDE
jgi:L-gulonate 3-dehydrogenase